MVTGADTRVTVQKIDILVPLQISWSFAACITEMLKRYELDIVNPDILSLDLSRYTGVAN